MRRTVLIVALVTVLALSESNISRAETEEQVISRASAAAEQARESAQQAMLVAREAQNAATLARNAAPEANESAVNARIAAERARNLPSYKREKKNIGADKYVGELNNGMMRGYGVYLFLADDEWKGDRYEGEFREDLTNGYGVYFFLADDEWKGDRYEGEHREGLFGGYGVYLFLADNEAMGDRYEGEFREGQFDGYGVGYHLADNESKGDRYEGEYREGIVDGYGIYYHLADDEWKEDRYEGEFLNDIREGYGVYYFFADGQRKGHVYEGDYKNGFPDGYGVYHLDNGERFEGQFSGGKQLGYGVFSHADGTAQYAYWEDFQADLERSAERGGVQASEVAEIGNANSSAGSDYSAAEQHIVTEASAVAERARLAAEKGRVVGENARRAAADAKRVAERARNAAAQARNLPSTEQEFISYENGSYDGEVKNGVPNGYGIYDDGKEHYEGEWRDGLVQGYGVYQLSNGDHQECDFVDFACDGYGVQHYADGSRYEGEFRDDQLEGYGVYSGIDGIFDGEWRDGIPIGYGIISTEEDRYEGEMTDAQNRSYGIYYYANGSRQECNFLDFDCDGYGVSYSDGEIFYAYLNNGEFDFTQMVTRAEVQGIEAVEHGDQISGNELVRSAQEQLSLLDYYAGDIDGISGPETRAATSEFQEDFDFEVTGKITERLLGQLESAVKLFSALSDAAAGASLGIPAQQTEVSGSGTAFFVSHDGWLLTNRHVVDGCSGVEVVVDGTRIPTSRIVFDQSADLALIKTDYEPRDVASFREGRGIRTGDPILVLGYPLRGILAPELNATAGIVSAFAGLGGDRTMFQITAPVQPGNSGGPLIDQSGNVVGVVVSKADALEFVEQTGDIPENIAFSIKAFIARDFLDAEAIYYETDDEKNYKDTADIVAEGRQYTAMALCIN
jgi:S1-C subfamily serine protease